MAARFGRAPLAGFTGGAGGGGGFPAAVLPVGLVDGKGGGGLRPVATFTTGGTGAPTVPDISQTNCQEILSTAGGLGADIGPYGVNVGLSAAGFVTADEMRPDDAVGGEGRSAGAGGGAAGAGISSLRKF